MPTTRPVERPARIFYLALAPDKAAETVAALGRAGMGGKTPGLVRRLVIEKPFGRDLHSALELNQAIRAVFDESEIFRIDHYLGKETVNNIFILRFANTLFEPLWNRNAIDHVQITAFEAETVNRRGAYYETAGALRDMVQNHLLQLLAVVAMEPPNRFDAQTVRDEKVKVLRAIRPFTSETIRSHVLLGQYDGYRAEPNVAEHSPIETFAALKFFLDNPRWKGVPFYLRTGKGMSCRTTQIWITFKEPAHKIFGPVSPPDAPGRNTQNEPNRLLIQIQPSEGIRLGFLTKMPGTEMGMKNSELVFSFTAGEPPLDDAYGRLLLDLFAGEASLFLRNDEVEAAWNLIDPILRFYAEEFSRFPEKLSIYPVGEWGPDAAEEQMTQDGRHWLNLCPVLS